jgi:hypothetical protein
MRRVALSLLVCCGQAAPPTHVVPIASVTASASVAPVSTCPPYATHEAPSATPDLPPVPVLPTTPIRVGDAFTVYGAVHQLNARTRDPRLDQPITIVGVIVDTNLPRVDKCALHKTGHADPVGCVTEIPTFTIADDASSSTKIRALGWASNFAHVYEAFLQYRGRTRAPAKLFQDDNWVVDVPFPLPAVGAKVRVTGRYGATFTRASTGVVADRDFGIITVDKVETLEAAQTPAAFPQLSHPTLRE